jgi:hypothetical protein
MTPHDRHLEPGPSVAHMAPTPLHTPQVSADSATITPGSSPLCPFVIEDDDDDDVMDSAVVGPTPPQPTERVFFKRSPSAEAHAAAAVLAGVSPSFPLFFSSP